MNLLKKLLSKGPIQETEDDGELDRYSKQLWEPFPPEWSHSQRLSELPKYVANQHALAQRLLDKLGLPAEQAVDPKTLDKAWEYFLSKRSLKKRRLPLKRRPGSKLTELQATHQFDHFSLELIEQMGALFGIVLQQALSELRWAIAHFEGEKYMLEGLPVLSGFPGEFNEMNPTQIIITVAHNSIGTLEGKVLSRLAQRWIAGTHLASEVNDK